MLKLPLHRGFPNKLVHLNLKLASRRSWQILNEILNCIEKISTPAKWLVDFHFSFEDLTIKKGEFYSYILSSALKANTTECSFISVWEFQFHEFLLKNIFCSYFGNFTSFSELIKIKKNIFPCNQFLKLFLYFFFRQLNINLLFKLFLLEIDLGNSYSYRSCQFQ